MLTFVNDRLRGSEWTVRSLVAQWPDFAQFLPAAAQSTVYRSAGRWLANHVGKQAGGLVLVKTGDRRRGDTVWRVDPVQPSRRADPGTVEA